MSQPVATASVRHPRTDSEVLVQLKSALSSEFADQALKNSVKLLRENFEYYDWVGIYLVKDDSLVLAAYSGEAETEHVKIPIGQGICGLAAKQGETIIVPDVNEDSRYLMCFPSTRSEIVVPIKGTKVLGEIDIDSNRLSAFNEQDPRDTGRSSCDGGEVSTETTIRIPSLKRLEMSFV